MGEDVSRLGDRFAICLVGVVAPRDGLWPALLFAEPGRGETSPPGLKASSL